MRSLNYMGAVYTRLYSDVEEDWRERIEVGVGAYLVFESVNEDLHYFLLRGRWDVIGIREI